VVASTLDPKGASSKLTYSKNVCMPHHSGESTHPSHLHLITISRKMLKTGKAENQQPSIVAISSIT